MAQVIQLGLGAFMSSLGVEGRTKSWEAHESDHQFGENESTDIGKYWKSAQPRARVRPMAERPMWPCHSVYGETAIVERTISLLDFPTVPATISNRL